MSVRNVVATVATTLLCATAVACHAARSRAQAAPSYPLLGLVGTASVYGEFDGSILTVQVTKDGTTLCNSTSPLLTTTTSAFCNGSVGGSYVFVRPLSKAAAGDASLTVCSASRQSAVVLTRLVTPPSWPADLAIRVSSSNDGPYYSCS